MKGDFNLHVELSEQVRQDDSQSKHHNPSLYYL